LREIVCQSFVFTTYDLADQMIKWPAHFKPWLCLRRHYASYGSACWELW